MKNTESNKLFYRQQLNVITEYIHNNLDSKIDVKTLAELSHFSPFHFHRICSAMLGEPVGAYISRIRLETAAKMIRYTSLGIEEIAYSVGYDAPSSLSKQFKNHFGISPIHFRKDKNYKIRTPEIMETTLNIKKPKIIDIEDKQCLYYSMQGPYNELDYDGACKKLWGQVKEQKLFTAGIECFGLPYDDPNVTEAANLRYDACLAIHKEAKPTHDIGVKELNGEGLLFFSIKGVIKIFCRYITIFLMNGY